MDTKPILIVHPHDKTTLFLDRIKNHLIELFKDELHHFNIYPNDESHDICLDRIRKHPQNGIIIFLGHGRSDRLYGSKGDLYESSSFITQEAKDQAPDLYYYNDNFINERNIDVFSGKKVFCLACNSNEKIASLAMENGANAFIAFGDIPTSKGEFKNQDRPISNDIVAKMKTELNYIIKTGLSLSIKSNETFKYLSNTIRFITNQRLTDILINQKKFNERYLLADYLFYLQKECIVLGDPQLRMIQ